MKPEELIRLIDKGLGQEGSPRLIRDRLVEAGVDYSFGRDFTSLVIEKIQGGTTLLNRHIDFVRSLNSAFYRVAFAGVAAIILLLISIFTAEGSLSLNSLFGISESIDETIIGLLTDN